MKLQGIGGVFLYAQDPEALARWYEARLSITLQKWGETWGMEFPSADVEPSERRASTTFAIFPARDALAGCRVRLNWRVDDLDAAVRAFEGCTFEQPFEDGEYGRFARTTDPEGNGIELWQPPSNAAWPE